MTDVTCPHCGATTGQRKKGHSRTGLQRYRCLYCERQYTPGTFIRTPNKIAPEDRIRLCLVCGKETTNPKFCSSSCSAIYNNHAKPKRKKKQRFCKRCGTEISAGRTVCDACLPDVDWSKRTVAEIRTNAKYQWSSEIQGAARAIFRGSGRPLVCARCGYSKFVEICHIQAINTYSDDMPISVINSLDNLMALCRNCHWEFDHGLLRIEDIPGWE